MTDIPVHVHALMTGRVNSIEKLVVIVELGKRPGQRVEIGELLRALPFELANVRETLQELQLARLVTVVDGSVELIADEPDLDDLLRTYAEDPIGTVTALSKISLHRIRSMADAFAHEFDRKKK